MIANLRNLLGVAVLLAAAVGSWYWSREEMVLDSTVGSTPSGPLGYYLRDANISIMDEAGHILYEITAGAVEERPDENRTVLIRVHVRYSPIAEVPWELSAEGGEIPTDERVLQLSGAVELISTDESSGEPTIIRTPTLRFAPDDFMASTDSEVTVVLGGERLEAVGMSADLKGDYLQLESSVHGQFNP